MFIFNGLKSVLPCVGCSDSGLDSGTRNGFAEPPSEMDSVPSPVIVRDDEEEPGHRNNGSTTPLSATLLAHDLQAVTDAPWRLHKVLLIRRASARLGRPVAPCHAVFFCQLMSFRASRSKRTDQFTFLLTSLDTLSIKRTCQFVFKHLCSFLDQDENG